jgi:hypothetical protein
LNFFNGKTATSDRKPIDGPMSSGSLLELSLFSTCIFVFAALLMQFLLNVYTAWLLNIFSVPFHYSMFMIGYLSANSAWPVDQIYLVYGSGPLILSIVGLVLLSVLKKIKTAGWKIKLTLTWTVFLLVNAFPCGIIAGVFFFDGFGMAFHWFNDSYFVRGLIAAGVLFILLLFSPGWQWLFLKTSYTASFLDNIDTQKIFLRHVYLKPWIYGMIMLLFFNWPFPNFFWRAFLISLGYLALPFGNLRNKHFNVQIYKSDKQIFTSRFQKIFFAIVLILIWTTDNFLMFF